MHLAAYLGELQGSDKPNIPVKAELEFKIETGKKPTRLRLQTFRNENRRLKKQIRQEERRVDKIRSFIKENNELADKLKALRSIDDINRFA